METNDANRQLSPEEIRERLGPLKSSAQVSINIVGPGGCITYEAEIIKRALEAIGCKVEMTTSDPQEHDGCNDAWMQERGAYYARLTYQMPTVKMTVQHCPWGG